MKQKSNWFLVVACGMILAVEAPLVVSSLAADFEGAYPAWESAEAELVPESKVPEPRLEAPVTFLAEEPADEAAALEFSVSNPVSPEAYGFAMQPGPTLRSSLGR